MTFWWFREHLPHRFPLQRLVEQCAFTNASEVFQAFTPIGQQLHTPPPTPRLRLMIEDFDVDCFQWEGLTLVSERLRDALALEPEEVQYFAVDSTQCATLPKSMDYKIMHICVTDDVSDRNASDFELVRLNDDEPPMPLIVRSIKLRPDVKPLYPLFRDRFFLGYRLCTDELALRVLRSGCSGVRFIHLYDVDEPRPRVRGIEGIQRA